MSKEKIEAVEVVERKSGGKAVVVVERKSGRKAAPAAVHHDGKRPGGSDSVHPRGVGRPANLLQRLAVKLQVAAPKDSRDPLDNGGPFG
jgi:hypothetical protein